MNQRNEIPLRRKKRYDHVLINLMVQAGGSWKRIRAADWNEGGFNFILEQELEERLLLFRKGPVQFTGEIVWSHQRTDESVQMERTLNTLIITHLKRLAKDKDSVHRIIGLIRSPGRIEEKKELLRRAVGFSINDQELEALSRKERLDHHHFRYGVKVDSPEWTEIVRHTLEVSDVVLQLGKLGKELTRLSE